MGVSLLQQRRDPVLLPLAGARVQDQAGGEIVGTIISSTGGDHRLVSSREEGRVEEPLAWQGGRGAVGCWREDLG